VCSVYITREARYTNQASVHTCITSIFKYNMYSIYCPAYFSTICAAKINAQQVSQYVHCPAYLCTICTAKIDEHQMYAQHILQYISENIWPSVVCPAYVANKICQAYLSKICPAYIWQKNMPSRYMSSICWSKNMPSIFEVNMSIIYLTKTYPTFVCPAYVEAKICPAYLSKICPAYIWQKTCPADICPAYVGVKICPAYLSKICPAYICEKYVQQLYVQHIFAKNYAQQMLKKNSQHMSGIYCVPSICLAYGPWPTVNCSHTYSAMEYNSNSKV
jgi:hypothetical protein